LVTCEEDVYALCAFANCTLNEKTKTANCPCYGISGESQARIDVAPDAQVQPASALCNAISDGSLWPGADAVSTYSRELKEENGIEFDDNGDMILTWECTTSPNEVRLVPNCMLAPCRVLEKPVTNDYFAGDATMECTCPLIQAEEVYGIYGGLKDPCVGPSWVNTAGPTLDIHAMNPVAVEMAWEEVAKEFNGKVGSAALTLSIN